MFNGLAVVFRTCFLVEHYYNQIQKWIGFEDAHKMTDFVELEGEPQTGHKNSKQEVSSSGVPKYTHPEKTKKGQALGEKKLRQEWPQIKHKLRKVGRTGVETTIKYMHLRNPVAEVRVCWYTYVGVHVVARKYVLGL